MEANSAAQHLGNVLIFTMMLGMGMSMVWADVRRVVVFPRAVMLGTVCQMAMLPVVGWLLLKVYPQDPAIACGLMILTFCPGQGRRCPFRHADLCQQLPDRAHFAIFG
jgi:BASS family bile acid:Na+ symporter